VSCQAGCSYDLDGCVVIGHSAGVEAACGYEYVDFWPMGGENSRTNTIYTHTSLELAQLISQRDWIAVLQAQALGISGRDDHVIATRSRQWIDFVMNDAVELLAATRGEQELSGGHVLIWKLDRGEVSFAVGREAFIDQQAAAAVLEVVAFVLEIGDTFVRWADVLDFVANVLCVGPGERVLRSCRIKF